MSYAVITGASKGIGREIAFELASRGYHLLIVARNSYELQMVKDEVKKKFNVEVEFLVLDLSQIDAVSKLFDWVVEKNVDVRILVNNAGYGLVGDFE